ncbi:BglG family transcription antiterminator [Alicyclobacillus shizuokensis]|uniref:BglG family transcription antiterminator n=1 Tax=Alicyclobacillus shizuokensis TaxID=392014 RepID=UPI000834BDDE|nr:transcription antiterminator [Alicyclobacillus shizuokensis]
MFDRATGRGGERVRGKGQNDKGARFVVERVLNNNVVVVLSPRDDEYILIGKGLGFGARRGQPIAGDDPRVEKSFALVLPTHRAQFDQLFTTVRPEVVGIAEEIISFAAESLGCEFHEHIHVALPDHIGFALSRLQGNLVIENPFVDEIRTLYPREWRVAQTGARRIEERFQIPIPAAEVGFLTLHIHSATHPRGLSETIKVTDAVNLAVRSIEEGLGYEISRDHMNYARLVIHLRFSIQRVLRQQPISNPLVDAVREKLPESYQIAQKASDLIGRRIGCEFSADEVAYLAMHIARIRSSG